MRPHTIDAMTRLAGRQQTAVTVHHAGTPEATVVVQIGRAVIYLHSIPAADRFAKIWQGAQPDAEQLPRHRNLERGPRTGPLAIAEPSIVVHAAGTPAATVRLARGPRLEPTFLGIQVGNLALRLFDQAAFTATAEAFLQAQRAAREHLKRADPTRGERLRAEPALPRRTTAALREEPGLSRRASADPHAGRSRPCPAPRAVPSPTGLIPLRSPGPPSPRPPPRRGPPRPPTRRRRPRRPPAWVCGALPPGRAAYLRGREAWATVAAAGPEPGGPPHRPVARQAHRDAHREEGNHRHGRQRHHLDGRDRRAIPLRIGCCGGGGWAGPCGGARAGAAAVRSGRAAARAE